MIAAALPEYSKISIYIPTWNAVTYSSRVFFWVRKYHIKVEKISSARYRTAAYLMLKTRGNPVSEKFSARVVNMAENTGRGGISWKLFLIPPTHTHGQFSIQMEFQIAKKIPKVFSHTKKECWIMMPKKFMALRQFGPMSNSDQMLDSD